MRDGLEVKDVVFGGLRKISSDEFRESSGLDWSWEGLMDGTDVELVLFNNSQEIKKAAVYIVSRADIPDGVQWSWGELYDVKLNERTVLKFLIPAPAIGICSFDYRDYTGPLRLATDIKVSVGNEIILKKTKYYDIPAVIDADKVEQSDFDIRKALEELKRTTIMHDILIEGDPKDGLKSIKFKLFNFGQETQYIGIDIRAESEGSGSQTQFFYKLEPQEDITADICPDFIYKRLTNIVRLKLKVASIPELVFQSKSGRGTFLFESFEKDYNSIIANINYYFS